MEKIKNIISLCESLGVELLSFHDNVVLCQRKCDSMYITWNIYYTSQTDQGICFESGYYVENRTSAFSDYYPDSRKTSSLTWRI